jgi:hypothetical protein
VSDAREMVRFVPWPFRGNRFPPELGAVVMRSVLEGRRPALLVWHSEDNDWAVGDGIDDPNAPGACVATHLGHVVALDPSIAELAGMPPGTRADRPSAAAPWTISEARDEE